MRNLIKILFLCGIIVFTAFSCERDDVDDNNPLSGTSWKLIGFGNSTSNTLKKAEPEGDSCYILRFYANDIVTGWTSTNNIRGSYQLNVSSHELNFTNWGGTEINELFDGQDYVNAIHKVHSYAITNKGLALYYDKQTLFLLYKPLEQ